MDPDSATLLAATTRRCLSTFDVLISSLRGSASDHGKNMPPEAVSSQKDRLKIWADSLGAFQYGSASLDFRLRGLSSMKMAINRYLEQLIQIAVNSLEIVQGQRQPLEALLDGEELWESSSDSSFGLEDKNFSKTELGQNMHEIASILSDLFKISFKIRNPATRSTAQSVLRALPHEEIAQVDDTAEASHPDSYEQFDRALVQRIFGDWQSTIPGGLSGHDDTKDVRDDDHDVGEGSNSPGKYLMERWSRSITNRRRFFVYCRRLAENSAKEQEPVATGNLQITNDQTQQPGSVSGSASSTQSDYKRALQSATRSVNSLLTSELTEDIGFAQKLSPEIDTQSIISSATTAHHVDDSTSELPPAPTVPVGKHELQCPYCWIVCPSRHFTEKKRWKNHILRDLQPYMCTYPDCPDPDVLYGTRAAWLDHEAQVHRQIFRCFEHPQIFISKEDLKSHLKSSHLDLREHQIQPMADLGHASGPDNRDTCPFCFSRGPFRNSFANHLAYHQERLASFVARNSQPDEVETEEISRDRIEDIVPEPLEPSVSTPFSSELSDLSAAVAAAQAVISTCEAIDSFLPATKSPYETIQRWTIASQMLRTRYRQFETALEARKTTRIPEEDSTYYHNITSHMNFFHKDLKKLEENIASANLSTLDSNTTPSLEDQSILAHRIYWTKDGQLFACIDRHIRVLSINVDFIKALNNADMDNMQRALGDLLVKSNEAPKLEGEFEKDWLVSTADLATQVVLWNLSLLEAEAPEATEADWDITTIEQKGLITYDTEKEYRLRTAMQHVNQSEAEKIYVIASEVQLEAIRLLDEWNKVSRHTLSFREFFPLQERYVQILLKSTVMDAVFGKIARSYLDNQIIPGLDKKNPDLRDTWLSVGKMYYALNSSVQAEIYLRLALFQGYIMFERDTSRSKIAESSKLLCQIHGGKWGPQCTVALRLEIKRQIGYDPTVDSEMLEKAQKWCHEKGFQVQILDGQLSIADQRNKTGNTPLHEAALDIEMGPTIMPTVMENEMPPIKNANGDTALLLAIDKSNEAVVRTLLKTPSLVQVRDREHNTPLHRCRNHNILGLVLDAVGRTSGLIPLDTSIPINIDSTDANGRTALFIMCEQGHLEMMKLFLRVGADVKKPDKLGRSPIQACSASDIERAKKEEMILRLLKQHADPDQEDTDGNTARSELRRTSSSEGKVKRFLDQDPKAALLTIERVSAPKRRESSSTASTTRKGRRQSLSLFDQGARGSSFTD